MRKCTLGVLLLSTPIRKVLDLDSSDIRVQDRTYQGYLYPLFIYPKVHNTVPDLLPDTTVVVVQIGSCHQVGHRCQSSSVVVVVQMQSVKSADKGGQRQKKIE